MVNEVTIQVPTACSGPCYDFTEDGKTRRKVTVFLAPIAVSRIEEKASQISWGCNRGIFCADCQCRYSKKDPRKLREEENGSIETLATLYDR